jgi:hypothetical protein
MHVVAVGQLTSFNWPLEPVSAILVGTPKRGSALAPEAVIAGTMSAPSATAAEQATIVRTRATDFITKPFAPLVTQHTPQVLDARSYARRLVTSF